MQRLKSNQSHSCIYCKKTGQKTRAVWRSRGFYETACDAHIDDLAQAEYRREQSERRFTEADHQTWGRL